MRGLQQNKKIIMNKILFYKISFYKILEILEIGFFTSQRLFEVNIERWKPFWKIMRDENKLLSHHLAKAIKYLENIVYPLWEPRLVLIDLTPRFFNEGHIKLHICFFGSRIAERVLYRYRMYRMVWFGLIPRISGFLNIANETLIC